jgi:hypothetical protein
LVLLLKINGERSKRLDRRRLEGRATEGERNGETEGEEPFLERLGPEENKKKMGENGGDEDE